MIKKAVLYFFIAAAILGIFVLVFYDDMDFCRNKRLANEYVEQKYTIEFQLVHSEMGDSAWPSGRTRDEFTYYDITNDLYFQVYYVDGWFSDSYSETYSGKAVTDAVKIRYVPEKHSDYMLRCWNYDSETQYGQIVFFTDDAEDIVADAYPIISYLKTNYPYMRLHLLIASTKKRSLCEKMFCYEEIIHVNEIGDLFCQDFVLREMEFHDMNGFKKIIIS